MDLAGVDGGVALARHVFGSEAQSDGERVLPEAAEERVRHGLGPLLTVDAFRKEAVIQDKRQAFLHNHGNVVLIRETERVRILDPCIFAWESLYRKRLA